MKSHRRAASETEVNLHEMGFVLICMCVNRLMHAHLVTVHVPRGENVAKSVAPRK